MSPSQKDTICRQSFTRQFSFGKRPLPQLYPILFNLRQQGRVADLRRFRGLDAVAAGLVQGLDHQQGVGRFDCILIHLWNT
ncbi:hypothetical protein JT06_19275 [Desulfobulbus sp. Tol-SR]|nr:hypothetical protein JT06_19275 [Desulfobulbus sp. Tol-SR]